MKREDGTHTGNKQVGIRLAPEIERSLNEGVAITGLPRASFIRAAIVEKTEREKVRIEK